MDSKIVEERFSDRLKVLPFRQMETASAESSQQVGIEVSAYTMQEKQHWEFTVGEVADWLRR
jgi:hypothetical protein